MPLASMASRPPRTASQARACRRAVIPNVLCSLLEAPRACESPPALPYLAAEILARLDSPGQPTNQCQCLLPGQCLLERIEQSSNAGGVRPKPRTCHVCYEMPKMRHAFTVRSLALPTGTTPKLLKRKTLNKNEFVIHAAEQESNPCLSNWHSFRSPHCSLQHRMLWSESRKRPCT